MDAADWLILADSSASADAIGSAVTRIITSVGARLSLESPQLCASVLPDFSTSFTPECLTPSDDRDVNVDNQ